MIHRYRARVINTDTAGLHINFPKGPEIEIWINTKKKKKKETAAAEFLTFFGVLVSVPLRVSFLSFPADFNSPVFSLGF